MCFLHEKCHFPKQNRKTLGFSQIVALHIGEEGVCGNLDFSKKLQLHQGRGVNIRTPCKKFDSGEHRIFKIMSARTNAGKGSLDNPGPDSVFSINFIHTCSC